MPELKIKMPWKENAGGDGGVEAVISALKMREHYGEFQGEDEVQSCERNARISAHGAVSIVAFMDVTGLEICCELDQIFGEHGRMPDGADHTRGWQLSGGDKPHYFATTEPYDDGVTLVEEWCAASGWLYRTFPVGVGFWFPVPQGTRLIFMAPPVATDVFSALADAIGQRLPVWSDD